jgi:hypothetical protein
MRDNAMFSYLLATVTPHFEENKVNPSRRIDSYQLA